MKIIHLSDLHFGTESDDMVEALLSTLRPLNADMIIISGDFTQRGTRDEFQKAQDFMQRLEAPHIMCVPGNHDVPALNIIERLCTPYKKYKAYICRQLNPVLEIPPAYVVGINSARRALPHWNWANGMVSSQQNTKIKSLFQDVKNNSDTWRICTMHHPVHKVEDMPLAVTVFGRKRTMNTLRAQEVDLVLTGHVHHASITTLGDAEHKTVFVSASTTLSSRTRTQENGFNVITIEGKTLLVDLYVHQNGRFQKHETYQYKKP